MARGTRRRCSGEDGTAILEAAFLTPIIFLLLFGILEFGLLFYASQTITNGTTAIARSAAIAGSDAGADYQIVQAAKNAMDGVPDSRIKRIVIFKATGPTTPVPDGCKNGSTSSALQCNVYTPLDFSKPDHNFDCPPEPSPNLAFGWCPTTRKTALAGPSSPPDYLGIYIEYEHPWITGLFGDTITLTETKITKLEPTSLN